jgi:nitrous oxidase accessory protein NosD
MSPTHHRRRFRAPLVTTAGLALAAATFASGAPSAEAATHRTVVVGVGQSIQAAIDAADANTTIIVRGGVHAEQLTIAKDGITLVGERTRLVPPADVVTNPCSGLAGPEGETGPTGPPSQAGICVTGSDVELAPFEQEHRELLSVGHRVRDVTITGFQVEGFSGPNVALVGAAGARLAANTLVDGAKYGIVTVGSTGTRVTGNVIRTTTVKNIGLCADDVAPAVVDHNNVSGYGVGLCVQTQGADFRRNSVHDNCIGVYVDPGIGATVRDNRIAANNVPCTYNPYGIGVWLDATNGTKVTGNLITGHRPAGYGAGLVIANQATNNTVRDNRFRHNTLDVLVDSAGSGNIISDNQCTTSSPAGVCS